MRIVVIEDELTARKGIVGLIQRIRPDCRVVGTADNGNDGLALIERLKPDLVLSDVVMPGMNGLEMIKSIRGKDRDCVIVLLSGHSNFSFAQQAIREGVMEYLLKPISQSDMEEMLDRAESALVQKSRGGEKGQFAMTSRERALYLKLRGESGLPPRHTNEESYRPVLLCLDSPLEQEKMTELRQCLRAHMQYSGFEVHLLATNSVKSVLCLLQPNDPANTSPNVQFIASLYPMLLKSHPSLEFMLIGEERPFSTLSEHIATLMRAEMWKMQFSGREGRSIYELKELDAAVKENASPVMQAANNVCDSLRLHNYQSASEFVDKIERLTQNAVYDKEQFAQALTYIATQIRILEGDEKMGSETQNPDELMEMLSSFSPAAKILKRIRERISFLQSEAQSQVSGHYIISRIFELSEKHLDEPLNLEMLARKINISPKYLGQLFIRATGERYSNYLNALRVAKAQEYLKTPNASIRGVAKRVGFSDDKYFQRVFKRLTGISPGEYARASNGGE